ncbi:hypothetical protein K1719_017352 [Acacia pycnantha]|nr:hypothetical protein K1719_017352 [Acacia pycnantha]
MGSSDFLPTKHEMDDVGDQALQKALDYACQAGADCTPILQNGACYNPNSVKDHCSYAVNSYFQKKKKKKVKHREAATFLALLLSLKLLLLHHLDVFTLQILSTLLDDLYICFPHPLN